jgi:benzoyl-CoA reductase/2-hydroxyglutaryl-CoA dehydratase subunit BcrC/BadD/HgdB
MEIIGRYRAQGGLIGAVFPIHYPRALLRAFDILPVEVWGPPRAGGGQGARHLQPYICSIVHNAVSFLQSGKLDVADLLLVPHACDSLQGLGSVLIDFLKPRQPVLTLYMPRGRRASDVDFLAEELRSVSQQLEKITGRSPSEAELLDCSLVEEGADSLLAELYQKRPRLPMDDGEFYRLLRSREYLPAETFSELAQLALAQEGEMKQEGIPILLSGIVPEPMNLFIALREMGGCVVADDLACCGRRLYPAGKSEEPFQRMAERIVHAPPDPTRGSPICERLEHLLRLVQTSGAKGVVFYDVKFCEPELYDLPELRKGLREAGLASISIEVDLNEGLTQPVINRLAAFLEMIGR